HGIFSGVTGTAPDRTYYLEWRAVHYSGGNADFEWVYHEDSDILQVIYGDVFNGGGPSRRRGPKHHAPRPGAVPGRAPAEQPPAARTGGHPHAVQRPAAASPPPASSPATATAASTTAASSASATTTSTSAASCSQVRGSAGHRAEAHRRQDADPQGTLRRGPH